MKAVPFKLNYMERAWLLSELFRHIPSTSVRVVKSCYGDTLRGFWPPSNREKHWKVSADFPHCSEHTTAYITDKYLDSFTFQEHYHMLHLSLQTSR